MATFLNTYAALPMALTGALGGRRAARRVNETASFFAVTTLPGALDRHGRGFEAAAMVRLMHSMVRYNALKKSGRWDLDVYGIPIPQVDQMPAGLINVYLLARQVEAAGRSDFNTRERAIVEFSRYRCFLLGLPEELLPTTPGDIIHVMHARAATLRHDFDDEICGELVRATMSSYLKPTRSLPDRLADAIEKSYSKFFFNRTFVNRDSEASAEGPEPGPPPIFRLSRRVVPGGGGRAAFGASGVTGGATASRSAPESRAGPTPDRLASTPTDDETAGGVAAMTGAAASGRLSATATTARARRCIRAARSPRT